MDWSPLIQMFLEKNKQINLSAIRDEDGVKIKHIQDSLELEKLVGRKEWMEIADIGTWWGFPLMPLAMSHPECNFVWIDSIKKKTIAVWDIIDKLWIKNVKMIRTRVEEIRDLKFDLVTARAVAYADKLLNRLYPITKKWGTIAIMKQSNDLEKKLILSEIKKKNLTLNKEHHYKLFDWDIEWVIYIIKK